MSKKIKEMNIKSSLVAEYRSLKDKFKKDGLFGDASGQSGMIGKLADDVKKGIKTPGGALGKSQSDFDRGGNPNTTALNANESSVNSNQYGSPAGPANNPSDINTSALSKSSSDKSSSNSNSNAKIISAIGRGWNDSGDVIKSASKSLDSSKNYISNLGKVRDQYLTSIDNYKKKTDDAIAGNKTLIEKNQKRDLDILAGDTRKSIDNTNIMLGVKGASGGSASKMASRAIASSAGRARAGVLTSYGDETSKQNQASRNAHEDYQTRRNQAYEWEKTARQEALDEYNAQREALDRLKNKKSGWKDADIKAESDRNLNNFLSSINAITTQAKNFRDNLANKMIEYGGLADSLDTEAVGIDAPAELDTPEFNENIDLNNPNNAEDWYNPDRTGKRVIKGYDALGNPIYDDAVMGE